VTSSDARPSADPHDPSEPAEPGRDDAQRTGVAAVVEEFGNLDRNLYRAVAATPTPTLDEGMRRLSLAGDAGKLWFALAGATALLGGRRGRTAAFDGVVALLVSSAIVNGLMKPAWRRRRPDRELHQVIVARHVPLPRSTSFPSGHASSAFAFANGLGGEMPELALPVRLLAASVAWSRVHTGVHYPGDVIAGALVGGAVGEVIGALRRRHERANGGGG
jgi:undecaprenyl-diphosphatase